MPRVTVPPICIAVCWIAFVLYWAISACFAKPVEERQSALAILAHRLPTLLGAMLLAWRTAPPPLDFRLIPASAPLQYLGASLCVLGLAGALWSRTTLGRNWSSEVVFKREHELIQRGPYRWVRHPIYTALLLMCVGTAFVAGRLGSWLGLPLLFVGFWLKSRQEETLLIRHFPNAYPAYREKVKALIPFVF